MKLKFLESFLQSLEGFHSPKVELEQYVTSAHLASRMIFTAHNSFDQITNKSILDLGSGTGLLSIACAYLGSKSVLGVELDTDAIEIALENLKQLDLQEQEDLDSDSESGSEPQSGSETKELKDENESNHADQADEEDSKDEENSRNSIEFIQLDISHPDFLNRLKSSVPKSITPTSLEPLLFDTVVMNPPFGTKRKGIDMVFLEIACHLAKSEIYSLHKTSTRDYIQRKSKQWGFNGEVIAEMKYDLPKTMKMHKVKSLDIQVDLWRFYRIKALENVQM